jgi:2-oxoglutarate dehydrogenase complex dehydrogenase (E1) component-like enzyme
LFRIGHCHGGRPDRRARPHGRHDRRHTDGPGRIGQGARQHRRAALEELYPFPTEEYANTIYRYSKANEIVWCQEEPQNQGAWYQIRHRLQEPLSERHELYYAGRPGAAAPASGIYALHTRQQEAFVAAALAASGS